MPPQQRIGRNDGVEFRQGFAPYRLGLARQQRTGHLIICLGKIARWVITMPNPVLNPVTDWPPTPIALEFVVSKTRKD